MRSSTGEPFAVRTAAGPRWTGKVELIHSKLVEPLRWRKPQRVFVNSMSDLFHEALTGAAIAAVFGIMALCPHITFQVLTKRADRMKDWTSRMADLSGRWMAMALSNLPINYPRREPLQLPVGWPLPNVWLGVSVEDQATADARIPLLLQTPAAVRFVSYEPALGPVDFQRWVTGSRNIHVCMDVTGAIRNKSFSHLTGDDGRTLTRAEAEAQLRALEASGVKVIPAGDCTDFDPQKGCRGHRNAHLDWIIVGGESGPGARPFDVEWARSTVRQCRAAGVPVFCKQLGARPFQGYLTAKETLEGGKGRPRPADQQLTEDAAVDILAADLALHVPIPQPLTLKDRKGGDPSEWPEDLRVRQFPKENA